MPFLPPNQQCQSTEGNKREMEDRRESGGIKESGRGRKGKRGNGRERK